MRTTLVHNPSAGNGDPTPDALMQALREAGYSPVYCSTKTDSVAKALDHPAELVVVAGGDGTVGAVATLMTEDHPPLAIIPLGTANNIGRTLGIVGTLDEIVAGLPKGKQRKLDVGIASGRWGQTRFIEAVGVGALAEATSKKHKGKVPNKLQQGRDAFRKILAKTKPRKLKITLDDRIVEAEALFAEIMNMSHVGPQLFFAPFADPGDGRLDLALLPAESRDEALEWLAETDPADLPPITLEAGRTVTMEKGSGPLRVGDAFPSDEDADTVEVGIDRAISVLVPAHPGHVSEAEKEES